MGPAMEQALPNNQLLSGMRRNWFGGGIFLPSSPDEERGSTEPQRKMPRKQRIILLFVTVLHGKTRVNANS